VRPSDLDFNSPAFVTYSCKGEHVTNKAYQASFENLIDYKHCNYRIMLYGTQRGVRWHLLQRPLETHNRTQFGHFARAYIEGLLNTLLEYNMIAFNGFKCPRSCFLVEEGGISDQEPSNHQ
jgi:hypothetical protein